MMDVSRCVTDYDQLRQVEPIPHQPTCDPIFVAGLPTPIASGLQGFFEWRHLSTEDDDDGTVIRPSRIHIADPGRWHRVFDGAISTRWFGARGDGTGNDGAAIQAAINAAASSKVLAVYIPPGRYRLTHAIRPEFDCLTLDGGPGTVLVADPADDEQFPEAILVNLNAPDPPAEVRNLTLRGFTIEIRNGPAGDVSAAALQLNNCIDCVVSDLHLTYAGPQPKPKNIDGIATSQGTTGMIQGCIVDGVPKVGIYVAQGTHDLRVEACEVKNTTGPIGQTGISVAGADRITISNCLSHGNGLTGLLIAVNGPIGSNPPSPGTNIRVIGGTCRDNGADGILVGSGFDGVFPERVQLVGVTACNNAAHGISVEAGRDVLIAGATVADNGVQGIWIENVPIDPSQPRTARVQITGSNVQDNGRGVNVDIPGVGLRAAEQIVITGGRLSRIAVAGSRQNYGIGLYKSPAGEVSRDLRVIDVDASLGQIKPVGSLDVNGVEDMTAAAQSGFFRLQAVGDPEGSLAAPLGSEYVDLATGFAYRKAAGSGPTGWARVLSQ
jgi:hypothetical protein